MPCTRAALSTDVTPCLVSAWHSTEKETADGNFCFSVNLPVPKIVNETSVKFKSDFYYVVDCLIRSLREQFESFVAKLLSVTFRTPSVAQMSGLGPPLVEHVLWRLFSAFLAENLSYRKSKVDSFKIINF